MCTVSWISTPDGYHLFFNRDELRTRSIAQPPQVIHGHNTSWLSPVDPDGGGSWIAVNNEGIGIFLLNNYQADPAPAPREFRSRGEIVNTLADSLTVEEADWRLNRLDLPSFRPFSLGIIAASRPVHLACWDGTRLRRRPAVQPPLISSGLDARRVNDYRRAKFAVLQEQQQPDPADLEAIHSFFDQEDPEASVCMRRDDAATMSISIVRVTADNIAFRYLDCQPDQPRGELVAGLERRRQAMLNGTAKIAAAR